MGGNKQSRLSTTKSILFVGITTMMLVIIYLSSNTISIDYNQSPPPPSPHPVTSSALDTKGNPGDVISDSEVAMTMQHDDGSLVKIFKDEFFKNSEKAKSEMGSFMQTLESKSWWTQESLTVKNDDGSGNEEEHKDDNNSVDRRYFAYLPMGGGNNQFTSLQKAALLAKDLNRTLLIPPISPNSHIKVWSGPRYSQFYDIEKFKSQSGISVIEWHDIKQVPETVPHDFPHHWVDFSEDFPCIPNGNIGINNTNLYDKFRPQFLLNFDAKVHPADETKGRVTDFYEARDVLLNDSPVSDITPEGFNPNMWKCISCPYFLVGGNVNERSWDEVGLYFRFNDEIEAMVDDILDLLLGPVDNLENQPAEVKGAASPKTTFRPHPKFIIVHLRRGDITNKCPIGVDEKDCIVQIESIAERIEKIENERRTEELAKHKSLHGDDKKEFVFKKLPVLVATNEERETELEKIEKLGWILLDHGDEEKDKLGVVIPSKTKKLKTESKYGPWYPPMLDAVLLTRGNYLIGMLNSRMSILATQRSSAWHGHKTYLM